MLSIAAMGGGAANYYLGVAREDYFLRGGEPEGHWFGTGAERLGLSGAVADEAFRKLFRGFSPSGEPLVQNAGADNRQPGWDLTFSAPKSVSVIWSIAPRDEQKAIQACHAEAIRAALTYLESESFSRAGKGGTERIPVGLAVATFEHATSRALDPQLHTHALVLNVGVAENGAVRTVLSKPFYEAKMAAGAIYRVELAARLMERGYSLAQHRNWFEITGVSDDLLKEQSKRRTAVVETLRSRGLQSAAAASFATLESREAKELPPPRKELFARWRTEAADRGLRFLDIPRVALQPSRSPSRDPLRAVQDAVKELTNENGHFTKRDLIRRVAERTQVEGFGASELFRSVRETLANSKLVTELGHEGRESRFTTLEFLQLERKMLREVEEIKQAVFKPLRGATIDKAIEKRRLSSERPQQSKMPLVELARHIRRSLSDRTFQIGQEQAQALRHITQDPGRIKCIQGYAGTGKTTMLVAAREAFEKEGYRVLGCTVAANAAKTLERETGIASETLKMRFLQLNPATAYVAKHEAKQLLRAFIGKDRHDIPRLKLDKKTVVVLDEASMVGTRDFAKLIDVVHKAGSLLVCIGDKRQLPAIEAGGGFESICKRVGQAELTAVTRQRDELDRHAVKDLAVGKAEMALQHYAKKGQLTVAQNREAAEQALIGAWRKNGGTIQPKAHLILTGTKDGVTRLNQLAQKERIDAGFVKRSQSVRVEHQEIHVGDRIICLKNARALGLRNGATGEVTGIKTLLGRHTLAVRLDGERQRVLIPLKEYSAIQLGYAFTTHKAQGATVENAYVHVGERMTSRELSYVQGSRHKDTLQIFTDRNELRASSLDVEEIIAANELTATNSLILNMNRSVKKEMAHEHLKRRTDHLSHSQHES